MRAVHLQDLPDWIRDLFDTSLREAGIDAVWADVSRFEIGAEAFCYRLLNETGVLMFPGNSFGDRWRNWVRVSLLAPEENIHEALDRITAFIGGLGGQKN